MLTFHPALPADEPFLASLHAATFPPGLPPPLIQMQYLAEKASYEATYAETGHQIIKEDGQPIGRWWLHHTPTETRLVDIRLHPAAQRRGIGTRLLRQLQAQATRPIRLSVALTNPAARELYTRLGFAQTTHSGMHIQMEWRPAHWPGDQELTRGIATA